MYSFVSKSSFRITELSEKSFYIKILAVLISLCLGFAFLLRVKVVYAALTWHFARWHFKRELCVL